MHMSSLLPNLVDLLAALPDTAAHTDARQLATAAAPAENLDELDAALSEIVRSWLT
ncbi:hypothetical protein ACFPRL_36215 [Pseudoclavibacter helvolus]